VVNGRDDQEVIARPIRNLEGELATATHAGDAGRYRPGDVVLLREDELDVIRNFRNSLHRFLSDSVVRAVFQLYIQLYGISALADQNDTPRREPRRKTYAHRLHAHVENLGEVAAGAHNAVLEQPVDHLKYRGIVAAELEPPSSLGEAQVV